MSLKKLYARAFISFLDDLYNFLADSVKAFDDESARQFATIQEVTNSTLGKQKNFIPKYF